MPDIISVEEYRKMIATGSKLMPSHAQLTDAMIESKILIKRAVKKNNYLEDMKMTLKLSGIKFETEYRFAPPRKFRADIFIPEINTLCEYEGLVFNSNRGKSTGKSGHTTITGYTSNCEKYNLISVMGFRLLRYTALNYSQMMDDVLKIKNKQQ